MKTGPNVVATNRHACVGTSWGELDDLVGCGLRVRCLPDERDAVGEPLIVILGLRQAVFYTARCKSEYAEEDPLSNNCPKINLFRLYPMRQPERATS